MACSAHLRRLQTIGAVITATLACLAFCAAARADYSVQVCGSNPDFFVFGGSSSNAHIHAQALCPVGTFNGAGLAIFNSGNASAGQAGRLQANAPAGLVFTAVNVNQIVSVGINDGGDWGGGFYWAGGGAETNDKTNQHPNFGAVFPATSPYFGIQMICGKATCKAPAQLDAQSVTLYVRETVAPRLRGDRSMADVGLGAGKLAVHRIVRFAVRSLLPLRDSERDERRLERFVDAPSLRLQAVHDASHQSGRQHRPLRQWRDTARPGCLRCRERARGNYSRSSTSTTPSRASRCLVQLTRPPRREPST